MRLIFISLFAFWLGGCADENRPVATIAGEAIAGETIRAIVAKLPVGLRNKEGGDAARQQYLQSIIDRRLLLTEAAAHGMDTLRAVTRKVRETVDGRVIVLYRSRFLAPEAAVPEGEVRRVFEEEGYDRERKLNAILVRTRAEIDEVVALLATGRPFAEVAREYSLDERSAEKGGELGFIGREAAPGLHVPAAIFNSLPEGEISAPLAAGHSWHVVLFTADRPTPYERYRPMLEDRLFGERMAAVEAEHYETLREAADVALDPTGLSSILDAARRTDTAALETSEQTLYGGKEPISIAAAWRALNRLNAQRALQDSLRALAALERLVLNPTLMRRAALEAGLYNEASVQQLERRARENTLLDAMRKRFAAIEPLPDAEVWTFYDSHPDLFYHEASTQVEELLIADLQDALDIEARIAAGTPFAAFADRSVRKSAIESKARFHFHPRDEKLYPQLVPAILAAKEGELTGPVRVQGGYSLFRVEGQNPGGVESYEKVQQQARALLRRERENQAFENLVKDLRQRYADRITIDEDQLRQALPDSLVRPAP